MDYYINEYSLRGQFRDLDDFFASLREDTLPVMRRIEDNKENIIWKKDTLWQAEICNGIILGRIPQTKNERSGEYAAFRIKLIKLANQAPFWSADGSSDVRIREYKFDMEYRDRFEKENCFSKALETEGRIISFRHKEYESLRLPLIVEMNNTTEECCLDNLCREQWWQHAPEIKTWHIGDKYLVEVRANEFSYHPPHFHATANEYAAVFRLSDGKVYRTGCNKWQPKMLAEIKEWYEIHSEELKEAWSNLHNQ